MIELPRAALTAGQIAEAAEFFSFGTNDLTQTTWGFSRDDVEAAFFSTYLEMGIFGVSPVRDPRRRGRRRAGPDRHRTRPGHPARTSRSASAASTAATPTRCTSSTRSAWTTSPARRSASRSPAGGRPRRAHVTRERGGLTTQVAHRTRRARRRAAQAARPVVAILRSARPLVCGILNVTPDSFSDGGRFFDHDRAAAHGCRPAHCQGADLIDIGGESTRPGAEPPTVDEELDRVVPVVERLARVTGLPLSVDTSRPEVMRAAVRAGASMINDVRALRAPGCPRRRRRTRRTGVPDAHAGRAGDDAALAPLRGRRRRGPVLPRRTDVRGRGRRCEPGPDGRRSRLRVRQDPRAQRDASRTSCGSSRRSVRGSWWVSPARG